MRIVHALDDILGNRNHLRVLRHLTLFPSAVITGRGVARELGMSHVSCIRSLNALVEVGALTRKMIGTSSTYEIPPDSILFSEILRPMFLREAGLLDGLVKCLLRGGKSKVLAIYLFGSIARGEDKPSSDVDILIILKRGVRKREFEEELNTNRYDIYRLYRVAVNVITYSYDECRRKKQQRLPLIEEIISEGKLLWGKKPENWSRSTGRGEHPKQTLNASR